MTETLTETERRALQSAAIFSALSQTELTDLLGRCRLVRRKAGWQVFGPTEKADRFFVLLAGRMKIFKLSARGDEQILHLYGPSETFGEAAMWMGIDYPAFAVALTDVTLLIVPRQTLRDALADSAELAMGMLAGLSNKLHEFNQLIEQLSLKEVPARLAAVLLAEADKAGSDHLTLKQSKRQLAAQIGIAAETLSRALTKLKSSGCVEVRGRRITILDRRMLDELAEGK